MRRIARNFGVAGLPVNGKYQAVEKFGIVWPILHWHVNFGFFIKHARFPKEYQCLSKVCT